MDLNEYVKKGITQNAQKLINGSDKDDELAIGKLAFLLPLSRVLNKKATLGDVGTLDAINDTLQQLGLVANGTTFYKQQPAT